jgi:hypothetical protein
MKSLSSNCVDVLSKQIRQFESPAQLDHRAASSADTLKSGTRSPLPVIDIDAQRMSDGVVAFGRDGRRLACLP